ncbi:hypothetical protein [Crocinitomix catalasitica]|uniref:hypothetical protein n=1 Tax=Crocinitomix catalasitica TaxID=184607 RepID=UPI00048941E6|nr:hypothetical protein [Crocinitomix catalasitica]
MKTLNILLLFTSVLLVGIAAQSKPTTEPVEKIAIINGIHHYYDGVCFTDETYFESMSFRVVNGEEIDDNYKIIEGIIYLKSNAKNRLGKVGESGTFEFNSEEPLKGLEGEQVNVELKVINETTGERSSFTFYFYANATPEVFLGTTKNGDVLNGVSELSGKITVKYTDSDLSISFNVLSGTVSVEDKMRQGNVLRGGALNKEAKQLLANSSGSKVTIFIDYQDEGGLVKRTALVFDVK